MSEVEVNAEEYQRKIEKIKPKILRKDFYNKHKFDGEKIIEFATWKTIFNNELACLKAAQEIMNQLEKNKILKWSDPEFGPTD